MRNIPSYTFTLILEEKVPRTMILLELIAEEKKREKKEMEKSKKKR